MLILFVYIFFCTDAGLAPSEKGFFETKDVVMIGPIMCRYTYFAENDCYYFHFGKRNPGKKGISRSSFTKKEGEKSYDFLKRIHGEIMEALEGELIPSFEGNLEAATMKKSDVGFWDESPFCFRSIGLVIRVTFDPRTDGYRLYFLRPNRNLEEHPNWIGSTFVVNATVLKDLINYMKKKMKL